MTDTEVKQLTDIGDVIEASDKIVYKARAEMNIPPHLDPIVHDHVVAISTAMVHIGVNGGLSLVAGCQAAIFALKLHLARMEACEAELRKRGYV